ncbi:hypothetical protein ACFPIJ_27670 [Dactylosporangium cerinum]|uniref:Uncharacterized protein n=1 Tax=Dactylosporangium cerinum TaxID=1434730 RepID=A0ABV9VYY0_9ACTN
MIALAWQTVRARAGSFAGSFVALAFGVALLTASALSALSAPGQQAGQPRGDRMTRPETPS